MTKAQFESTIDRKALEGALPSNAVLEIHDEFVSVKLSNGKTIFLESVVESLEAVGHEIIRRDPDLEKRLEESIKRIYGGDDD